MSRRRPPRKSLRGDETVVTIVCSDGGQHVPPRVLGKVEIFGLDDDYGVEVVNLTGQENAARTELPTPHLTYIFRCRKCGREPRILRTKLIPAARAMAAGGERTIDISVIERLSNTR